MISVYNNKPETDLTPRRIEIIEQYNKIISLGRKNPVWFIENILGIPLMDYQKVIIMNTWTAEEAVWLMSRSTGKSFLGGIYISARSILYPNHRTYIMTGTADMSKETFSNIENIAMNRVATLRNLPGVLLNELVKTNANNTGFTHEKQSYSCKFYNGSFVESLIGTETQIVGKRSELNYYDEAGKISQNYFDLTEPFTALDSNFQMGAGIDNTVLPLNVPRQHLYTSSAEDVSSHLYQKYKECAKSMMMGLKDRYCIDLNCEIPMHPTRNGKEIPPLLNQKTVDRAMNDNSYRAMREYYNIFDTNGGTDCIVGRDVIRRNQKIYLPVFGYEPKKENELEKKYGIFYDPAMRVDGSAVIVGEFIKTEARGWSGRIVNVLNLIHISPNGDKALMRFNDQVDYIRKLMVAYNGPAPDWENLFLFVDPGSGGQGSAVLDLLMEEFTDDNGVRHCGVIDEEDDFYIKQKQMGMTPATAKAGVVRAWSASKYKTLMYDATADMFTQDLVTFLVDTPLNRKIEIDGKQHMLTKDQLNVFLQHGLMVEEYLLMRKQKTESGNYKYAITPEKARTVHDDRPYCLGAFSFYLQQIRREDKAMSNKPVSNLSILLNAGGIRGHNANNKVANPFAGRSNPFSRR